MYYIGISAYYHESSVFLTDNKGTDCFVKEESFSRIKGDKNFPQRCLKFLIKKQLKKIIYLLFVKSDGRRCLSSSWSISVFNNTLQTL